VRYGKGADVADQQNVQLVRGVFDAFSKGDMNAVGKVLAGDIVWRWPGRHPLAGDRHSKEELFKLLGQVAEETSGTERVELRGIAGGDENVVVLVTVQAERNGKTLATDMAMPTIAAPAPLDAIRPYSASRSRADRVRTLLAPISGPMTVRA
jgi:uncharacterized protein